MGKRGSGASVKSLASVSDKQGGDEDQLQEVDATEVAEDMRKAALFADLTKAKAEEDEEDDEDNGKPLIFDVDELKIQQRLEAENVRSQPSTAQPMDDPEVLGDSDDEEQEDAAGHDFDAWRTAWEEQRKKRKVTFLHKGSALAGVSIKPNKDELLARWRQALEDGDFTSFTAVAIAYKAASIASLVRSLTGRELIKSFKALVERYIERPRERAQISAWLHQILDRKGFASSGRPDFREALRPLVRFLAKRLGQRGRSEKVDRCIGTWKLALALAQKRLKASEDADGVDGGEDQAAAGAAEELENPHEEEEEVAPSPKKKLKAKR